MTEPHSAFLATRTQLEKSLAAMSPDDREAFYSRFNDWFDYEPNLSDEEARDDVGALVEDVMSADPVATEGGLLDFLLEEGVVP